MSVSGITDIGGASNSQNQDAFFTFHDDKNAALVVGLFDGHGRDAGRDVAIAAKCFFEGQFHSYTHDDYARLEQDPDAFFQQLFAACHHQLKCDLREIHERAGHIVEEHQPEGFLVLHDLETGVVANARGGTTSTIVVVLNGGRTIYTSNVGDSVAMMATLQPVLQVEVHGGSSNKLLVAEGTKRTDAEHADELNNESPSTSKVLLLSGNHSPDCADEFYRAREACCNPMDASLPALRFVYDTSAPRSRRLPIFTVSSRGELQHNSSGDYYKNVRDEWATVVATPFTSAFPDALAFTRSLGDFHMHSYGVSCQPTVSGLSLERIVQRNLGISAETDWNNQEEHASDVTDRDGGMEASYRSSNNEGEVEQQTFMLLVASDGIWDNWTYHDIWSFLRDAHNTKNESSLGGDTEPVGVDDVVSALMATSLDRAKSYFGDQADNMTAVLVKFDLS